MRISRLKAGDVEGYLAGLEPQAAAVERPFATGALLVPLEELTLTLDRGSIRGGADAFRGVGVDLGYRYAGLPEDNAFRVGFDYDLVRVGDSWRVTTSTVRAGSSQPVWATGPIETQRSEHFLALHRPGLSDPSRIMDEAEQARAQLDGKITFPLENSYLLVIAKDEAEYASMSSATLGPVSAIAQVETSYEVTPDSIKVLSRQMVINDRKLHEDGSALETFRHELGHLAVAQYTRPFTPAWVSESAAMYLAGTRPTSIWRQGLRQGKFDGITIERLTQASNLGEHGSSKEGASLEYAYSAAAAWYLVESFGPERYWEFYRSYANVPPAELYELLPERTSSPQSEQAIEALAVAKTGASLQGMFGLNTAALDTGVRDWMSKQQQ